MRYYKFGFLFLSLLMFFAVSNAVMLTFKLESESLSPSTQYAHIHFGVGGNDFGGVFVWRAADEEVSQEVGAAGKALVCDRKVKGLYYNSQRGERLRPLDDETFSALGFNDQGLIMSSGLFTSCNSGTNGLTGDSYGIYGALNHSFQSKDYVLLAGVQYNTGGVNTVVSNSPLASTFQRFDNKYPLGLLYDYNGGIGFVGCEFKSGAAIDKVIQALNTTGVSNFFEYNSGDKPVPIASYSGMLDCTKAEMALDQLLLFKIQGIIGMSSDINGDTENLGGNEASSKTQYFSTVNVNNATLVNQAKRRAEELCRGKWSSSLSSLNNEEIICLNNATSILSSNLFGKTVIVKGDLTLNGSRSGTTAPVEVFVDGGTLTLSGGSRINFDDKGYPSTSSVSSGIFYKGNFIINGLVKVTPPTEKYYIHGKFTSLNTYATPDATRIMQVKTLLSGSIATGDIDLTKVFQWRCGYTGSASDGSLCMSGEFRNAPLVIINQNYPSKLLQ